MQSVSVGELKSRFSEILERVREGEEIVINFGKQCTKEDVLALRPFLVFHSSFRVVIHARRRE
ncbi:MAG: type II toxin-antitoxin system prevent-host-death family antitoxin [Deltaproteobacteria bacterium]|nr:type II toxin-antitoxin system prevent-host-death family antitoxin [Deltaproteobacteria bacterium]